MKKIAITQRVSIGAGRGERRDCLDQAWPRFLAACGLMPLALPNVIEVALALCADTDVTGLVLTGGNDLVAVPNSGSMPTADYVAASPGYFRIMGVPLLSGRSIDARDVMASPRVTVISASLARIYFPNQDPIGRRMVFGWPRGNGIQREIVGVVGDVRDTTLGKDPEPMMYVPFAQAPFWGAIIVSKTSLTTGAFAALLRKDAGSIDKDLPVNEIQSLPDALSKSVAQPRFRTFLLGLFGAMALLLAAAGIFGVISYSVSSRTHELGIRVALGAQRGTILWMILSETLVLAVTGLAIGIPCALAASRLLARMLFGISPNDPVTLASVAFVLAAVAALAGYIPARRAMRVDPIVALRHE